MPPPAAALEEEEEEEAAPLPVALLAAAALPAPFYVYLDTSAFVVLGGVYFSQQSTAWAVPNLPQYLGYELIVQSFVLPLGSLQAPALQFPPGWRLLLK